MPLFTNNLLSPSGLGYGLGNSVQVTGATTGNTPVLTVIGDTNTSLQINTAGTGSLLLPTAASRPVARIVGGVTTYESVVDTTNGTALECVGISAAHNSSIMLTVGGSTSYFTSSGQTEGILLQPMNTGTGNLLGLVIEPNTTASGTVSNLYGTFTANFVGASATVTSSYHHYVQTPIITAGGAITTQYGIYIALQKASAVTTGYGIYQFHPSDTNHFAGPIESFTATTAFTFYGGGTTSKAATLTPVTSGVNWIDLKAAATGSAPVITASGGDGNVDLTLATTGSGVINTSYAVTALGGGSAPTFGTIGGSGPATAAQNSWLKVKINGTASFLPVWR